MKTKNIYSCPIEEKYIKKILTIEPPGHIIYRRKDGSVTDLTNAVDFLCDEGTPVRAAFDGEVFDLVENLKKSYNGIDPPPSNVLAEKEQEGNFVVLKHENNEYSICAHLKLGGVLVNKGQQVKRGDIIGYSGHTGWSIEPHLHFAIFLLGKDAFGKKENDLKSLEIQWDKHLQ